MAYRLEVRLSGADVGSRVVIRWRRPAANSAGEEIADVLGMLEAADASGFAVRKASGELVIVPRQRALAGKTVPPAPYRGQGSGQGSRQGSDQGADLGSSPGPPPEEGSGQ